MDIIPPLRWNVVESGLSRGGYPVLRNFRHLSRNRLKTIVSLIPESPSSDLVEFAKITGIELVYISVNRSLPLGHGLLPSLIQALNICIDEKRHPIYLHCLDGRRIVGLVVLLLRRLQGWSTVNALAEFWRFQTAMRPVMHPVEIEKTTRDLEKFVNDFGDVIITENIPRWLWNGNRGTTVHGVRIRHVPPLRPLHGNTNSSSSASSSNLMVVAEGGLEQQNRSLAGMYAQDHHSGAADNNGSNASHQAFEEFGKAGAGVAGGVGNVGGVGGGSSNDNNNNNATGGGDAMRAESRAAAGEMGLGPGALKALQLLRSHSHLPVLRYELIPDINLRYSGSTLSASRMGRTIGPDHPLIQSPLSRAMDALCLNGLEALSSRLDASPYSAVGGMGNGNNNGIPARDRYGGLAILMQQRNHQSRLNLYHASNTIAHLDVAAHASLLPFMQRKRRAQRESLGEFGENERD